MEYSEKLGLSYQYYQSIDQIIFEDGVCYKMREAIIVSRISTAQDMKAVHLVKSVFGGEIIHESKAEKQEAEDKSWFELEPPVKDELYEEPALPVKKKKIIDAEILSLEF